VELARVQRAGDATDGRSLAAGIPALEYHDDRLLADPLLPGQHVQLALVFLQQLVVALLFQALRHVQGAQQLEVVQLWHGRRCLDLFVLLRAFRDAFLQRLEKDTARSQAAEAVVGTGDHDQGAPAVLFAQHLSEIS
jgi:hypothetical protein